MPKKVMIAFWTSLTLQKVHFFNEKYSYVLSFQRSRVWLKWWRHLAATRSCRLPNYFQWKWKLTLFRLWKRISFCLLIQRELWLLSAKWLPIRKKTIGFWKRNIFLFMENTEPHLLWGRNIHLMKDW